MLLRFSPTTDNHEAWFAQHYDELLRWALQITSGDPEQAEDLVHDAFVHFMTRRPDLSAIDSVNGYLYTSLRNLHLSNARRATRRKDTVRHLSDFELLDYESLRSSLQVVQELRAAEVRAEFQHQLRAVWRYAQARKHSSKMASILTLRFFHGYYPEEITRILRISRDTTDQLLRRARKEARLFIATPQTLPAASESGAHRNWPADGLLDPPDLALALHEAALRSDPDGICLSEAQVAALYGSSDATASISTPLAAHIVSCRACLQRVTDALGLPPLSSRHPLDSLGYDTERRPPDDGPGAGTASFGRRRTKRQRLDTGRQRLSDLLAQAPRELRIAANGVIVGSQQVTSALNRQTLRIPIQSFDFLEVFSEEDVRLLLLNLEAPPRGPVHVHDSITLNGERRLDVRVTFADTVPMVDVSYVDPTLAASAVPAAAVVPPRARSGGWLSRLFGRASRPPLHRWRPTRGGAFATVIATATIAALLLNPLGRPVLSAAELLERSTETHAVWTTDRALAVHRTVDLEARSTNGATTRRRIEVWQSAARGLQVRRAYDANGALVASEWIGQDGSHAVRYAQTAALAEPTLQGLEAWRIDPSAAAFTRIVGTLDGAVATRDGDDYRVSLEDTATGQAILAASLTLRADYHAVEQRAVVRTERGTTELTWVERAWTPHPTSAVPADAFAPPLAAAPAPMASPVVGATASLELAALTALRQIDADLGDEVRVRRLHGRLEIAGVVASAQRQAQVRAALATLARHPAVRLQIDTVAEAHARARRRGSPRPLSTGNDPLVLSEIARIPVDAVIRDYVRTAGVGASAIDDEVAKVANDVLAQVNLMRLHAWALRNLLDQMPAADVERLDAADRQRWRALIADHGRGFVREGAVFRTLLEPLFPDRVAAATGGTAPSLNDRQLRQSGARLAELAVTLNDQIEAAFTIPNGPVAGQASFDPRRCWSLYAEGVALAAALDAAGALTDGKR